MEVFFRTQYMIYFEFYKVVAESQKLK